MIVVGKACGESVLRGAHVYIKGILGAGPHSMFYSLPPCTNLPPVQPGQLVSVWADINSCTLRGECITEARPGYVFVGNGTTETVCSLLPLPC